MHGLRHAYAQNRYEELTGRKCPVAGGLESRDLTSEQREVDRQARLTISRELGHKRESVTLPTWGDEVRLYLAMRFTWLSMERNISMPSLWKGG